MRKIICSLLVGVILLTYVGCRKADNNTINEMCYGSELYNSVYAYNGDESIHIIPIMSKKDMTKAQDINIEADGGKYELDISVEDGEYSYKEYHLYRICLKFSDVVFDSDIISVSKINVYYEDGDSVQLDLDKCELVKIDGEYNCDYIDIIGSALRIPSDMKSIPIKLSAEEPVEITNIYLTNDSFKITNFVKGNGDTSDTFEPFILDTDGSEMDYKTTFDVNTDSIGAYKNYGTTVIIEYSVNGKLYYTFPAIPRTIYNPFDTGFDGIENYFNSLT